jgi:hypothetical protein
MRARPGRKYDWMAGRAETVKLMGLFALMAKPDGAALTPF